MNEPAIPPPPLPVPGKPPLQGKWIFWIVSAAVLPGLAFATLGGGTAAEPIAMLFFLLALLGQLIGSIVLGIALSKRLGRGGGMAVLLVFVLLGSSVAVGCCSAAAGCAVAGSGMDFK
jgi:hypothetical protein